MRTTTQRVLLVATLITSASHIMGTMRLGNDASRQTSETANIEPTFKGDSLNPGAQGQYAEVNGLKMYYEIHGSGVPLVLLHGAFGFIEGWSTILPTLAKTHQVIAIELEGHGHTRDLDRPLSFDQMAEDTASLLKQLKIREADFFGYGMGGTVALGVAIRHPELVRRLAVLGSAVGTAKDTMESESYKQFQILETSKPVQGRIGG